MFKRFVDYEALVKTVPVLRAEYGRCELCATNPAWDGRRRGRHPDVFDTRFDRKIHELGLRPGEIAALSSISRHTLRFYRAEVTEPARDNIARIVLAVRALSRQDVRASDLFYLGEAHDDALPEHQRSRKRADRPWARYGDDDDDDVDK